MLLGAKRLLDLFPDAAAERIALTAALGEQIEQLHAHWRSGKRVAVLVSGDPGFFSAAHNVIRRFGRDHCTIIPAVSSLQVAFARLGLEWGDAKIFTAHGRSPALDATALSGEDKIAILGGTAQAASLVADLADELAASHRLYVCENLTLENERIECLDAGALRSRPLESLAIALLIRKELMA